MIYAGPRRPDWTRTGSPSPREMDALLQWRDGVLRGLPSLAAASIHVQATAMARGRGWVPNTPGRVTNLRAAIGAENHIPRPPGLPDDHPMVLEGSLK